MLKNIEKGMHCYVEGDIIDYLNKYVFTKQESVMIKNLGWVDLGYNLPREYRNPYFNF